MKKIIIILLLIILAVLAYLFIRNPEQDTYTIEENASEDVAQNESDSDSDEDNDPVQEKQTVIGTSVQGNEINAYHFGKGDDEILFVGGLHGGYSWNTSLLMYELIDYLEDNAEVVPENIKVTVIPVMNPDGLEDIVGTTGRFSKSDVSSATELFDSARFNSNDVDLNRNFDCEWQPEGTWKSFTVSGGSSPFSEPESQALRSYVQNVNPVGAVVWYSSAGGVYSSSCKNGVSSETSDLIEEFADASGYPAYKDFDFYEITGDAVNWLAKENIPAISVLLTNHQDTELNKNIRGIKAVLDYYAQ